MQKEGDGNEVKDSIADFGMYVSESPFKPCDSVKEPVKREWHDEHGDDEYIGKDGLYMAAYENKVKFLFKGNAFGANEKCKAFIDYLRKSGMMKMYCDFNRVGRQHVRLKSIVRTCTDIRATRTCLFSLLLSRLMTLLLTSSQLWTHRTGFQI